MHKVLTDSVHNLLKHVQNHPENPQLMLTLIRERKAMVMNELNLERMFLPDTLPPLIKSMYNLEYLFESHYAIRVYGRLLAELFEAEQSILANLVDQNEEAPASES